MTQWGVMHPDGWMLAESAGYPFSSRRLAQALAIDLDDECDCGKKGHRVMRREISEWMTT